MADVQQTYKFKFEFDRKDVKKQLREISIDVKDAISQIGDASDKVVVFKELVSYLSNVDKALDAFKTKHKDDFSNIFGNPDKEILGVLTEIFNTTQQSAQAFATLKDKIAAAESGKANLSTLRGIAEEVNSLFISIGKIPPIDINEMFIGKGSKAKGTDFAGRIKLLNDALAEFGVSYSGFQNKLKGGFSFGGSGGPSKAVQEEIEKLKKQKAELQEIIDSINNHGKIKVSLVSDSDGQIKQLRKLKEEFDSATSAVRSWEEKGLQGSPEHLKAVSDYVKSAAKAISAFNSDDLSIESMNWIGNNGLDITTAGLEKFIDKHKSAISEIQNIYSNQIASINIQLNKLQNANNNNEIKQSTSLYNELNKKMREYFELKKQLNNVEDGSDEYDDIQDRQRAIQSEILTLKQLTEDQEDSLYNIFDNIDETDIPLENALTNICNTLSIEIPQAAGQAGETIDTFGKKIVNISEYVSALSGQLKEMFAAAGRSANFEYHIAIDGLDIKARHGAEKSVDLATQTETYLDTLFSDSVLYGHSHRGGTSATNIQDIESVLSSYRDGVSIPVHFVVGKDAITTMDFTGVSKDVVDQLMQEIAATNSNKNAPVINESINKIVERITGKSGALKTWSADQFDDLARYLYDVSSAASSALTPIEKFQAVLDNMFGKGRIDASKYESLLSVLDKDNAKSIFNQIASMENLQPINTTDMLTMGQVNAEIDASIAKYKALREEANLSYSDIRNEVDKVIEHYNSGGGTTSGLDFFQQYFPEGEWQKVRDLLTDAYENVISIEEVTNRIANEFAVDPYTFAQIPNEAQASQIDQAKAKLESFLALTKEIHGADLTYWGNASDNVEIGKYVERLETAKAELDSLGDQGALTAEQLKEVDAAFTAAKTDLEDATRHYDGYGWGDASSDEVRAAEEAAEAAQRRASEAENELEDLRQENALLAEQLKLRQQITIAADSNPADIYNKSADSVKTLIDRLMISEQKITTFNERTSGVKLDNFNKFEPTDFQRNYILAAYDELKKVQQEIANMPIIETEDDKQKLRELQEEALRLYSTISQAHMSDSDPQAYMRAYGLSADEAVKFKTLTEGGESYKLKNNLLEEYKNEYNVVFDEISQMHDALTQHILANGEKWTQFGKEQFKNLYSGPDYQKILDDKLSTTANDETIRQQEEALAKAMRINLTRKFKSAFGDSVKNKLLDDSQFDAYDEVLEEIRNGTITTLDQCINKFEELSNSSISNLTSLSTKVKLIKDIANAYDDLADAQIDGDDDDKEREKVEALEEQYYGLIATMKDGSKVNITLDDEFSETTDSMLRNAAQIQDIQLIPRSAEDAMKAYESLDMVFANLNKRWTDPDTLERAVNSFDLGAIDQFKRYLQSSVDAIKLSDPEFKFGSQEKFDYAVQRLQKLEELSKRISLTNIFTGSVPEDIEWTDKVEDAYREVLQGIRSGTYTTVEECNAKFKELTNITNAAVTDTNVDKMVSDEVTQFEALQNKLLEVKAAVDAKTQAFEEEYVTVDGVVDAEITSLQSLINQLQEVVAQVNLVNDAFNNINTNASKIELSGISADQRNAPTENVHYVTDPQGRPVTMYRGIRKSYSGLISNRYHGGTFSTDNLELAKEYAGELGKVEKVLLSMKNPMEIDGRGALWNRIEYIGDNSDEASRKLYELNASIRATEKLLKKAEQIPVSDKELRNISRGFISEDDTERAREISYWTKDLKKYKAEKAAILADTSNPYGRKNTNELVEIAKAKGYDGVIFKNIIDSATGDVKDLSNVMVTFEQDQIHYLETISSTFESSVTALKNHFGDLTQHINASNEEVESSIRKMVELRGKVNAGEISEDEYRAFISENAIARDYEKLAKRSMAVPDFITGALDGEEFDLKHVVQMINDMLDNMRHRVQKVAKAFGKEGVSFDELLKAGSVEDISSVAPTADQTLVAGDVADEVSQLERLQAVLIEVKNSVLAKTKAFYDEGNVVGQVVGKEVSALNKLLDTINDITPKVDALSTKMASVGPINLTTQSAGNNTDTTKSGTKTEDKFQTRVDTKKGAITKYIDELKGVQYVTDDTREKLIGLRDALDTVKTPKDLNNIIAKFEELQTEIGILKASFEKTGLNDVRDAERKLLGSFNTLNIDQRLKLREERDNVIQQLKTYENAVLSGQRVEISAIENTTRVLREKIEVYQEANKEAKKAGVPTGGNASFGSTASINATAKYNSLKSTSTSKQFANSSEVMNALSMYEQKYQHLIKIRDEIRSKDVIDESDKEAFKTATTDCNNYAKALDKIINNSLKLKSNKANPDDYMLGSDFKYSDVESRKAALADFVKQMYGVNVAAEDFKDNWNKVVFAVDNGDGTFTQMTATFTDARNEIVALAGDTQKVQTKFQSFIDGVKNRLQSLSQYFIATVGIYDVWNVIKQGVQYVREIDSALTELRKVTNETDASYKQFLQDMSKTASVTGSTVKDLTNSSADWARLNI